MRDWKNASRAECVSEISAMLATLATNVKINSKCNRNDLAVISEHTICGLLNRMHGWNLRNANTPKYPNFPGVDLVDEIAGVAVQVTVDNSVKKVDHTLEKFKEHKLNRTFSKLILMVITDDEPTAAMKNREDSCFYGKRDIWNITYLIREIENIKSVDILRDIAEYLDKELGYTHQIKTAEIPKAPAEKQTETASGETITDTAGSVSFETTIIAKDPDDGDIKTQIIGKADDFESLQTQVISQKDDSGSVTTIRITRDTAKENTEQETTETKQKIPLRQILTEKIRSRKESRRKRAARKQEKPSAPGKPKKKWLLLLVPASLLVLWLLVPPNQPLKEMPPELADYSVTINGEKISLPTTLQELERLGWVRQDAEKTLGLMVPPHTYYLYTDDVSWSGGATLTNGYGTMDIKLGNPSNHVLPIDECIVYEITCYSAFDSSYTGEAVNTLECPLGLTWKQSSFRDIKWPKGYKKETGYTYISYTYELSSHQQYELQFSKDSRQLNRLRIKNQDEAAMAALTGNAYDTQPPEYDLDELAEWLGVSMTFQIGDLFHKFNVPVGTTVGDYQNLGYTIDKQPEFVVSGEHEDVYFRCNTLNQFSAAVCNPFHRAQTPENCFICSLDTREMEIEGNIFLFFSAGEKGTVLSVGMNESILRNELKEQGILSQTGDNGTIVIYPNPSNREITVTCWLSGDSGKVTRIRVDICKALCAFMEQQKYQNELEQKFQGIG